MGCALKLLGNGIGKLLLVDTFGTGKERTTMVE